MSLPHRALAAMKFQLTILVLTMSVVAAVPARAQVSTSYWQNVNSPVPDDNPNGLTSTIQASSPSAGGIDSVSVSLDLTSGWTGDYYAYLVDPAGDMAVLLNRVGVTSGKPFGYSDSGFNVTFSSSAANDIHFYQAGSFTLDSSGLLTGTWAADGRNVDPESSPLTFDTAPRTAGLNSLLGSNPNGTWTLLVADLSGGFQGTLVSWQLAYSTVPEPTTSQLMVAACLLTGGFAFWRSRRARPPL